VSFVLLQPDVLAREWKFTATDQGTDTGKTYIPMDMDGGVRFGIGMPELTIAGRIPQDMSQSTHLDLSWIASSPWSLLAGADQLSVSGLHGTVIIEPGVALDMNFTSPVGTLVAFARGQLTLDEWVVKRSVHTVAGYSTPVDTRYLDLSGKLIMIASADAQEIVTTLNARLSPADGDVSGTFFSDGGWSPLPMSVPGRAALATPPFTGQVDINRPNAFLRATAQIVYDQVIDLGDGQVIMSKRKSSNADGPVLTVGVHQGHGSAAENMTVTVDASVTLDENGSCESPPALEIEGGHLNPSGPSALLLTASDSWSPFANSPLATQVPLEFSGLHGKMELDSLGFMHFNLLGTAEDCLAFGGWLTLENIEVQSSTVRPLGGRFRNQDHGQVLADAGCSMELSIQQADATFANQVLHGFKVRVSGSIDAASGAGTFTFEHSGGWAPLTDPVAEIFAFPKGAGTMNWQSDGQLNVSAPIQYTNHLNLCTISARIPCSGTILLAHPLVATSPASYGTLGPTLDYSLMRAAGGRSVNFDISMEASLVIPIPQSHTNLTFGVTGELFTMAMDGKSNVNNATKAPDGLIFAKWTGAGHAALRPAPLYFDYEVPQLAGQLALHQSGRLEGMFISEAPQAFDFGSISFTDAITTVAITNEKSSADSLLEVAFTSTITLTPGTGNEFIAHGEATTDGSSLVMKFVHEGGWCPFISCEKRGTWMDKLITQRMEGVLHLTPSEREGPLSAKFNLVAASNEDSPIDVIPGVLTLRGRCEGSPGQAIGQKCTALDKGPGYVVTIQAAEDANVAGAANRRAAKGRKKNPYREDPDKRPAEQLADLREDPGDGFAPGEGPSELLAEAAWEGSFCLPPTFDVPDPETCVDCTRPWCASVTVMLLTVDSLDFQISLTTIQDDPILPLSLLPGITDDQATMFSLHDIDMVLSARFLYGEVPTLRGDISASATLDLTSLFPSLGEIPIELSVSGSIEIDQNRVAMAYAVRLPTLDFPLPWGPLSGWFLTYAQKPVSVAIPGSLTDDDAEESYLDVKTGFSFVMLNQLPEFLRFISTDLVMFRTRFGKGLTFRNKENGFVPCALATPPSCYPRGFKGIRFPSATSCMFMFPPNCVANGPGQLPYYMAAMLRLPVDWGAPFPTICKRLTRVNMIELSDIQLDFEMTLYGLSFGLETATLLGTGSSNCEDSGLIDSQCLNFQTAFILEILPDKKLPGALAWAKAVVDIEMEIAATGTWFEPLALRNFALLDPVAGAGMRINPAECLIALTTQRWDQCIELTTVRVGATFLYSLPNADGDRVWPGELYDIGNWPIHPIYSPFVYDNPDLVVFELRVNWQRADQHQDRILKSFTMLRDGEGMDLFGARLVVQNLRLSTLMMMFVDVIGSVLEDGLLSVLIQEAFGVSVQVPMVDMSFVDEILLLEFDIIAEFANAVTEWFQPGVYVDAQARAVFFGFYFDFQINANMRIPSIGVEELQNLFSDPLKLIEDVGMQINATVILPFDIGQARFLGIAKPLYFLLEASIKFRISAFQISAYLAFELDVLSGRLALAIGGDVLLSVLGELRFHGFVGFDVSSGDAWFNLEATVDIELAGICLAGWVVANDQANFAVGIAGSFGPLGAFELSGAVSGGGDPKSAVVQLRAMLSVDMGAMIGFLIEALIYLLTGIETDSQNPTSALGLLPWAIKTAFEVVVPLSIYHLAIDYDSSRSFRIEIGLRFFTHQGIVAFDLPNPTNDENGRRRRELAEGADGHASHEWLQWGTSVAKPPLPARRRGITAEEFRNHKRRRASEENAGLEEESPTGTKCVQAPVTAASIFRGLKELGVAILLDILGPVDYSFNYSIGDPDLLPYNFEATLTFHANSSVQWLEAEASLLFLGFSAHGKAGLNIDGSMKYGYFKGCGVIDAEILITCPVCPRFEGCFTAEKTITQVYRLGVEVSFSWLGLEVSGSVMLNTKSLVESFHLTADGTNIGRSIIGAIIYMVSGVPEEEQDPTTGATKLLYNLFGTLAFPGITFEYNPRDGLIVTIETVVFGFTRTIEFEISSNADNFVKQMTDQLGFNALLRSLAPLDWVSNSYVEFVFPEISVYIPSGIDDWGGIPPWTFHYLDNLAPLPNPPPSPSPSPPPSPHPSSPSPSPESPTASWSDDKWSRQLGGNIVSLPPPLPLASPFAQLTPPPPPAETTDASAFPTPSCTSRNPAKPCVPIASLVRIPSLPRAPAPLPPKHAPPLPPKLQSSSPVLPPNMLPQGAQTAWKRDERPINEYFGLPPKIPAETKAKLHDQLQAKLQANLQSSLASQMAAKLRAARGHVDSKVNKLESQYAASIQGDRLVYEFPNGLALSPEQIGDLQRMDSVGIDWRGKHQEYHSSNKRGVAPMPDQSGFHPRANHTRGLAHNLWHVPYAITWELPYIKCCKYTIIPMSKVRFSWDVELRVTEEELELYLQMATTLQSGDAIMWLPFSPFRTKLDISKGNSICSLVPSIYEMYISFQPFYIEPLHFQIPFSWCTYSWCNFTTGRIELVPPKVALKDILFCDYLML